MRQNTFAVTELKLSHFAVGLCWEHPCGLLLCLNSGLQTQQTDNLQLWEKQFQTRVDYQSGIACYNIFFSLKETIFKFTNPLNGQSHRSLTKETYSRNQYHISGKNYPMHIFNWEDLCIMVWCIQKIVEVFDYISNIHQKRTFT